MHVLYWIRLHFVSKISNLKRMRERKRVKVRKHQKSWFTFHSLFHFCQASHLQIKTDNRYLQFGYPLLTRFSKGRFRLKTSNSYRIRRYSQPDDDKYSCTLAFFEWDKTIQSNKETQTPNGMGKLLRKSQLSNVSMIGFCVIQWKQRVNNMRYGFFEYIVCNRILYVHVWWFNISSIIILILHAPQSASVCSWFFFLHPYLPHIFHQFAHRFHISAMDLKW